MIGGSWPRKGVTGLAIGPVQSLVRGFSHPDFSGEIIDELERLGDRAQGRAGDSPNSAGA